MNKKVVLVKIDSDETTKFPPFGILAVGSVLKRKGFDVKLYHISRNQIDMYSDIVAKEKPLFLGVSTMSVYAKISLDFSKRVREKDSAIPIVWGGIHPTMVPLQCLESEFVDIVVMGSGERVILDLANAIGNKKSLDKISNIGFKKMGKPHLNEFKFYDEKSLDDTPFVWSLIEIPRYVFKKDIKGRLYTGFYYYSSLGCPHSCTFCYLRNERINSKWRSHSIGYVMKDLRFLRNEYGINLIEFSDENFLVSRGRVLELIRKMNSLDIKWTAGARVDYIDRQFAEQLSQNGCLRIGFGTESGNNRILSLVKKGFTKERIYETMKIMSEFPNIGVTCSFISGIPTETKAENRETINFILDLEKLVPDITATLGPYLPYPGVPLEKLAIRGGFIPPKRIEENEVLDRWDNKINISWIKWANTDYFVKLGYYLALHYNLKNSIFDEVIKWRLKNQFFHFPIEYLLAKKLLPKHLKKMLLSVYRRPEKKID